MQLRETHTTHATNKQILVPRRCLSNFLDCSCLPSVSNIIISYFHPPHHHCHQVCHSVRVEGGLRSVWVWRPNCPPHGWRVVNFTAYMGVQFLSQIVPTDGVDYSPSALHGGLSFTLHSINMRVINVLQQNILSNTATMPYLSEYWNTYIHFDWVPLSTLEHHRAPAPYVANQTSAMLVSVLLSNWSWEKNRRVHTHMWWIIKN